MRDLNDLNFFAAVVTHGGFSAAARALDVPKSRISRRISALEERLGVRLIERSTRRFSVTEVGQDVYRHARAVMAEADAIDEVASRLKAEPQGLVRVGCPIGAARVLAEGLPHFLDQHPRLRVQLIVTNRRIDLIEEGVDVAVRARETLDTDTDLQMKMIGRMREILVASPDFLAQHGAPQAPADIAQLPTLSRADRAGAVNWLLTGPDSARETVTHEPRFSAGEYGIVVNMAIAGMGIALLPEPVCYAALADGKLKRVLPDWRGGEGNIHLVFPSKRGLLPGVRAFIDFAAESLLQALNSRRAPIAATPLAKPTRA